MTSFQSNNFTQARVQAFVPEITFNLDDGHPIEFIHYDEASQSFTPNESAMEVIMQYSGNVGLVFNMGEKMGGKSFLLNKTLDISNTQNQFQEKTKSMMLWTRPLFREEEYLNLFFIDVQGFDHDQNFENFTWLLSFLLGSLILYSSKGIPTDETLIPFSALQFVSQNLIISEQPLENEYLLSYYAPKLIWLFKETSELPTEPDGRPVLLSKLVESYLRDANVSPVLLATKNFILNTFKDRSYISFSPIRPRFNDNVAMLSNEYVHSLKILKEKIYSKAINKPIDGLTLSSKMVVHFLACICELFNKRSPVIFSEVLF